MYSDKQRYIWSIKKQQRKICAKKEPFVAPPIKLSRCKIVFCEKQLLIFQVKACNHISMFTIFLRKWKQIIQVYYDTFSSKGVQFCASLKVGSWLLFELKASFFCLKTKILKLFFCVVFWYSYHTQSKRWWIVPSFVFLYSAAGEKLRWIHTVNIFVRFLYVFLCYSYFCNNFHPMVIYIVLHSVLLLSEHSGLLAKYVSNVCELLRVETYKTLLVRTLQTKQNVRGKMYLVFGQ